MANNNIKKKNTQHDIKLTENETTKNIISSINK